MFQTPGNGYKMAIKIYKGLTRKIYKGYQVKYLQVSLSLAISGYLWLSLGFREFTRFDCHWDHWDRLADLDAEDGPEGTIPKFGAHFFQGRLRSTQEPFQKKQEIPRNTKVNQKNLSNAARFHDVAGTDSQIAFESTSLRTSFLTIRYYTYFARKC